MLWTPTPTSLPENSNDCWNTPPSWIRACSGTCAPSSYITYILLIDILLFNITWTLNLYQSWALNCSH